MKLIHAADLHLDRAFRDRGLRLNATKRRRDLVDALLRTLDLVREHDAAALCIAGDLYEHEHVTADTEAVLVNKFRELDRPVLLLPGNHDPYLPGSVYQRADWPAHVHVFTGSEPTPYELDDQTVIWGMAYTARELRADDLLSFRVPEDGRRHLLLLHSSLIHGGFPTKPDALPVTSEQLRETGADFVMLGHYHGAAVIDNACYPGSPEPLTWGEQGRHAVNVLSLEEGEIHSELVDINQLRFDQVEVDVSAAASSVEVEERLRNALGPLADHQLGLRVQLTGEVDSGCEIMTSELAERFRDEFAALELSSAVDVAFNLDEIAAEPTAKGRFVRKLLDLADESTDDGDRARTAAETGLRALEERARVIDVDGLRPEGPPLPGRSG